MEVIGRSAVALVAFFTSWAAFFPIVFGITPITAGVGVAILISGLVVAHRGAIRVHSIDLWFLAYVSVLWFSAALSENTGLAMVIWRTWFSSLLAYVAVRVLFRSDQSITMLAWAGVLSTFVTWLNAVPTVSDAGDIGRAAVEGLNTNFTAYAVAGYLYVFLVYASLRSFSLYSRLVHAGVIVLFLSTLLALDTRGALVAAGAMLIYWVLGSRIPVSVVRASFLLVSIWALLFSFGYLDFVLLLLDVASERATGDLAGRGAIWIEARDHISRNWLFGIGTGQFFSVSQNQVGAHNFVLTVALDSGVVGLVIMLGFLVALGRALSRARLGPRRINLGVMFFAYWIPIALSGHWELAVWSWVVVAVSVQMAGFATAARPQAAPLTPSSRPRSSEPC